MQGTGANRRSLPAAVVHLGCRSSSTPGGCQILTRPHLGYGARVTPRPSTGWAGTSGVKCAIAHPAEDGAAGGQCIRGTPRGAQGGVEQPAMCSSVPTG